MTLSVRRKLATLVAAGLVALTGVGLAEGAATAAPTASATTSFAQAAAVADGYYTTVFDQAIYQVKGGVATHLTYDQWVAAGSPKPVPAPTTYLRYAWAPVIFAQTRWTDVESGWATTAIDGTEWARAGFPVPTAATWIPGAGGLVKYATSAEIFNAVLDTDGNGYFHKLSYAEWQGTGFIAPTLEGDSGFLKLTWRPEIVFFPVLSSPSTARVLNYARWRSLDFPTPQARPTLPGDVYCLFGTSPTVVYYGAAGLFSITYEQWTAAGRPAPQHC